MTKQPDLVALAKEMAIFAKELEKPIEDSDLGSSLKFRSQAIARLTTIGETTIYAMKKRHQDIVDGNEKLPEWKIKVLLENTDEYRVEALRRRLVKTIEIQSNDTRSRLIERQSERKLQR